MKRKNVLMLCSWLDLKKKLGSFFIEQAHILNKDSNISLAHIEKKITPLWKYYKYLRHDTFSIQYTNDKVPVYTIMYPHNSHLPTRINIKICQYFIRKFFERIEKEQGKIDIIHAQSIFDAGLHANYINDIYGVPFVFTEHNQLSFIGIQQYKVNELRQILKKPYSKLVVSFDKIRQFATNHLFADFIVIGNAIDEKIFNSSEGNKLNLVPREDKILIISTIGAFYPIKDQITILKALEIVDNNIDVKLIYNWIGFNGWGHDETQFVNESLKQFNFKNIEVRLFPFLPKEEIAEKLKQSDLFVFSSLTEGMPVSVLEALACGVPVCTTNCGGVDQLINNDNGKIIQIKDVSAMADFIIDFVKGGIKRYDREKISENTIENFGSEIFRKKMLGIYQQNIR